MASLSSDFPPIPKLSSSTSTVKQQNIMKLIISTCFISANILSLLPFDYKNGNRIPSIIFRRLPSNTFHAFAMSLVLAFSSSFIALMIEKETKLVRQICWYLSVISMALAGAILAYAISLSSFN
ncbi:hypothetical protein JCGZ_05723 [Jatropha curcas]|uniref:Uncharacterized protein n=1 Tax=Jatropha curcas TaxID=180498 RepID=A0A067L742_JATCU|nr:hypothetical protein JCGZ_05723 [Jatropha curcas]